MSDSLISHLESVGHTTAIPLIRARDAFGRKKYGQPLMSEDGRDTALDALQEMGDLLQYVWKARLRNESLTEIRALLPTLQLLLLTEK